MTETEQLKKAAQKQYAHQRADEIKKHLHELMDTIDVRQVNHGKGILAQVISWLIWLVSIFFSFGEYGFLVFVVGYLYHDYHCVRLQKAFAEFHGAIKTLKILGLIDDFEPRERKRRKLMREFADMVKGWFTKKREEQEKVYAPV